MYRDMDHGIGFRLDGSSASERPKADAPIASEWPQRKTKSRPP